MMISPSIVIVRRQRRNSRRKSLREIGRNYFGRESAQVLMIELLIFVLLAAASIWPVVNAASVIRTYLL